MTDSRHAFLRLEAPGWQRSISTSARPGRHTLEQRVRLAAAKPGAAQPVLRFRGSLDRPPFAEITEVSPLPPTGATTELRSLEQILRIEAPALAAVAEIRVAGTARAWEIAAGQAHLDLGDAPDGPKLELTIACSLVEAHP